MELFRVFPWDGLSADDKPGGPLFVPRRRQGSGRHDNPELYGILYASLEPISSLAEALQPFRTQVVTDLDFQRGAKRVLALATLEIRQGAELVDLDDPAQLQSRQLRPSQIATFDRHKTQGLARGLYREDAAGFLWWSTLESLWINCTLFYERARAHLRLAGGPSPLSVKDERVQAAARHLGVQLSEP